MADDELAVEAFAFFAGVVVLAFAGEAFFSDALAGEVFFAGVVLALEGEAFFVTLPVCTRSSIAAASCAFAEGFGDDLVTRVGLAALDLAGEAFRLGLAALDFAGEAFRLALAGVPLARAFAMAVLCKVVVFCVMCRNATR